MNECRVAGSSGPWFFEWVANGGGGDGGGGGGGSDGGLVVAAAGRRDYPRCRDIKLVVTNQVQYDHRWPRPVLPCAAVGIWSTMKSARGPSGCGRKGIGRNWWTSRVRASVSSAPPVGFGAPSCLAFCRSECNFPFLSFFLLNPLLLFPSSFFAALHARACENHAVWGDASDVDVWDTLDLAIAIDVSRDSMRLSSWSRRFRGRSDGRMRFSRPVDGLREKGVNLVKIIVIFVAAISSCCLNKIVVLATLLHWRN